ncbi:hypothetical protein HanPI659440_Chr05g0217041 [Helianthus annuus]|nr:hypothetical protein HanPI659440_Chr05g0217041 [Helianthus annuus]
MCNMQLYICVLPKEKISVDWFIPLVFFSEAINYNPCFTYVYHSNVHLVVSLSLSFFVVPNRIQNSAISAYNSYIAIASSNTRINLHQRV